VHGYLSFKRARAQGTRSAAFFSAPVAERLRRLGGDMAIHTQPRQEVIGDEKHSHAHEGEVHTHDHWHVVHHHKGGVAGEFEHRSSYHQHEHNHAGIVHAHEDRSLEAEKKDHDAQAHTHDHNAPTGRRGAK